MQPLPNPSPDSVAIDQAFARFARRGDPADLATVFDAAAPTLLRIALHLTGDPHVAEDLVQETFVASIEARNAFATGGRVGPWLLGILRNRARRAWRARSRTDAAARPATDASENQPLTATLAAELSSEVDAAIQQLPESYRPVLRLHLRNQLSAAHIALALERPPGSVRTQIARGLALLRQRLPRGLAAGALVIAPRDLGAVRVAVLADAAASAHKAPVPATSTIARIGAIKKTALVGAAAATAALATLAAGTDSGNHGSPITAHAAALDARVNAARTDRRSTADDDASARSERELLAPAGQGAHQYGTVLVRATWAEDHTPAAGVTVWLFAFRQANAHLLKRTGLTGERGTVRIAHVPVGEITASTDGSDGKVVVEADRECVVDLQCRRWARVTGTVLDADGKSAAGAIVLRSDYFNPDVYPVAVADQRGRFAIDVGEARYLGARLAGHIDSHLELLRLKKGETLDVVLRLRGPAASVAGTVRDTDGRGVPYAQVVLALPGGYSVEVAGGGRATKMPACIAETDAEGGFRIDGIEPGRRQPFVARALGYGAWHGVCALAAGETQTLDVTLPAGCIVEGRVLDAAGGPVAGAWLAADAGSAKLYADFETCTAQSAGDGTFRIDSLPTGLVQMRAGHQLGSDQTTLRLSPDAPAKWDARLDPGPSIVGRVVDERGKPRPGFVVAVQSYDVNASRTTNAPTDADGRFALRGLRDEPLRISLSSSYQDIACLHVDDVRPGADELVLRVPDSALPSARVRGSLAGSAGRPLHEATVYLWQENNGRSPGFQFDDANGSFALGPVPPGQYRVVACARGCPEVHLGTIRLEAGATLDLGRVVLGGAGTLRASVFAANGNPVADETHDHVAILTPTGDHVTDASLSGGGMRIDSLAPGPYLAKWRSVLQPFSIVAGEATDLAVRDGPRATCALTLRETDERKAERPHDWVEVDLLDAGGRLLDRAQVNGRQRFDGDCWQCDVLAVPGQVVVVVRVEGHERGRQTVTLRPGLEIKLD
jgi:RNA polymerase sigma-70 factor (ECF subfamily)